MGGFNSIRGDETVGYADNFSFDGTERGGKMTTDGQLWIGSTTGRHVRLNTITAGAGTTITNGPGTITIAVNNAQVGQTITGDSGGALNPTSGNWNILGQQAGTVPVMITTGSGSTLSIENRSWLTQLVVDPSATVGLRGTFATIATALTAAVSGQDIFIRPGTYTENLTLKAGVNLIGFMGDGETPQVTIIGNCTATFAGTCSISNIRLQTNSAALMTVSGNSATIVRVLNCFVNCSNNTGLTHSSSSGSSLVTFRGCFLNLGTIGIGLYSLTGSGNIQFQYCIVDNTGSSLTASTNSAGAVSYTYTHGTFAISTSSTGLLRADYSQFNMEPFNTAALTLAGTGNMVCDKCQFLGGTASAISIGAGTTATLTSCKISSSNTNAITGAGTLSAADLTFTNTSSTINATTQTGIIARPGIVRNTLQPAFYAYLGSNLTNATGDGTIVTLGSGTALTEVYDQNNNFVTSGTFTAPYTGIYSFVVNVTVSGITAAMTTGLIKIVATGTTYTIFDGQPGKYADNANVMGYNGTATIAMTAADTCTFTIQFSNGTKVGTVVGANGSTWVSGFMVA